MIHLATKQILIQPQKKWLDATQSGLLPKPHFQRSSALLPTSWQRPRGEGPLPAHRQVTDCSMRAISSAIFAKLPSFEDRSCCA